MLKCRFVMIKWAENRRTSKVIHWKCVIDDSEEVSGKRHAEKNVTILHTSFSFSL